MIIDAKTKRTLAAAESVSVSTVCGDGELICTTRKGQSVFSIDIRSKIYSSSAGAQQREINNQIVSGMYFCTGQSPSNWATFADSLRIGDVVSAYFMVNVQSPRMEEAGFSQDVLCMRVERKRRNGTFKTLQFQVDDQVHSVECKPIATRLKRAS